MAGMLSLSAAAGGLRAACISKQMSVAYIDMHTAALVARILRAFPVDDRLRVYTQSCISLPKILPVVGASTFGRSPGLQSTSVTSDAGSCLQAAAYGHKFLVMRL